MNVFVIFLFQIVLMNCLILSFKLARISTAITNTKAERGHPCLIPLSIFPCFDIHPLFKTQYLVTIKVANSIKIC